MKTVASILTLLLTGYAVPSNNKLPDWVAKRHPKPVNEPLGRSIKPIADTQAKRENLYGNVHESTRQAPRIRHSTGTAAVPRLAKLTPRRRPRVREEGRRVFTDQRQVEAILGEDPMALQRVSFKGNFNRHRKAGLEEFSYKGGRFTTQNKDETPSQWLTSLESNRSVDDISTKRMIKKHEGLRLRRYADAGGTFSIGYGHKIEKNEPMILSMTRAEADTAFDKDYTQHKEDATQIPGYSKADRTRKAALIDLTYNMGPTWYKKFPKFTSAFSAGKYRDAARELRHSDWYKQTGERAKKIVNMIKRGN